MNRRPSRSGPRAHARRGNAAVEFALLLPLFLYVLYALVSFAIMFGAQHLMTLAAAEGARASLQYQPAEDMDAALALRSTRACSTAIAFVAWIQERTANSLSCETQTSACVHDAELMCLQVTLTYPYRAVPLLPAVPLADTLVPEQLRSSATVQMSPMSLSDAAGRGIPVPGAHA
jgi:Flp pilus assembly protein TadG